MWAGIHHDGHTAFASINGLLNTQIYQNAILQHHVGPPIKATHYTSLLRFSRAKQCLIPNRIRLGHPGSLGERDVAQR